MRGRQEKPNGYRASATLLLIAVIALGGMVWLSTRDLLEADLLFVDSVQQTGSSSEDPLDRATKRDSVLAVAVNLDRDPFRPPVTPRPPRRVPDPEPRRIQPMLMALLYDNVDPSVQLRVNGSHSNWLRVGESFQGWVVEGIGPSSVTVSHDGERVVLYSP